MTLSRVHNALENPFDGSGLDDIWLATSNELRRIHLAQAQYPGGEGEIRNKKNKIVFRDTFSLYRLANLDVFTWCSRGVHLAGTQTESESRQVKVGVNRELRPRTQRVSRHLSAVYVCVHTYLHVYSATHVCMCVCARGRACMCVCVCARTRACVHVFVHTHTHTHTYTHTHKHTHTQE